VSTPAVAADAAGVADVVAALESSLHGPTAFSQADLEDEWSTLDLERDVRVVRDADRVVGYGVVRERGELWLVEGYVHPDALGHGIGKLIATELEEATSQGGARRIRNAVLEADSAAGSLLESLGYSAVRIFRELRIELDALPTARAWPDGLRVDPFDPEHDAVEFHAAHQESFADSWGFTPRDFESWSKGHTRRSSARPPQAASDSNAASNSFSACLAGSREFSRTIPSRCPARCTTPTKQRPASPV
jgi:ribosomal protein S18 acetylase RimI-like enzyme